MGSVCHGYMCILLYMKLFWCSGFPEIYARLGEGVGVSLPWVYVHSAIYETFGVVVFQRSMLDWRGSICLWYMCILLYVQPIWCSGFPEIYA